jgi:serine/threonine-protein kinase
MSQDPDPGASLSAGDTIGSYRIVRPLGSGAAGAVYLAEPTGQSDGPPRVALKILHASLIDDHEVTRRFHREAAILRRLRDEHLVGLLDFGQASSGVLYMALEPVEGRGLDEIIASSPVDPVRAGRIVQQICSALTAAHEAGVIHRDLKPSNVVLEAAQPAAGGDRVRVLDFGLAKVLRGTSDSLVALTQQNMVFGTPEYMAPEQARGDEVDARADVYAAGAILYELVTGKVPFEASTPIGVMTAHLTEPVTPPSSRAQGRVTPALEAVILHALSKERGERYPTAKALSAAIGHALQYPADVLSTLPPPSDDLDVPFRDTLDAVPAHRAPARRGTWLWIGVFCAIAAVLIGIAVGLL